MKKGATRWVILVGRLAIKIPVLSEWRLFLFGLLGNIQERQFAKTKWPELCPLLLSLPGGFLGIMRRARPLTQREWDEFRWRLDEWRDRPGYFVPVEAKRDSFGWFEGRIVAVDYGN